MSSVQNGSPSSLSVDASVDNFRASVVNDVPPAGNDIASALKAPPSAPIVDASMVSGEDDSLNGHADSVRVSEFH